MAHRALLLLAVVGLAAGQYFQIRGPRKLLPTQRQSAQPAADPSWQRAPSWTAPGAAFPPLAGPGPSAFSYRQPAPAPVRQECTAVSARVDLVSGVSDQVSGAVFFYQECADHPVLITGRISGLSPGRHGLHVHEQPNLTNQCSGAGGHFNPLQSPHGAQTDPINKRHVGDLGNIEANYEGVAEVNLVDEIISLFPGERDIFRRAVVVHSGEDDLGRGGNADSLKTGNAGMRLACGIIAPNNSPRC